MSVKRRLYSLIFLVGVNLLAWVDISRASVPGGHHQAEPPVLYFAHWILLAVALLIVVTVTIRIYKKKSEHQGLLLAGLFVLVGAAIYFLDQLPALHGYFDLATHQFLPGYHEPPQFGFAKFVYKMVLGAFLTTYAFLGMHGHDEHEEGEHGGHDDHGGHDGHEAHANGHGEAPAHAPAHPEAHKSAVHH